jgi:hypothetical protein
MPTRPVGYTGKPREYEVRWVFRPGSPDITDDAFSEDREVVHFNDNLTYVKSLNVESAIAAVKREIIKGDNYATSDKNDVVILNVILCFKGQYGLNIYNEADD